METGECRSPAFAMVAIQRRKGMGAREMAGTKRGSESNRRIPEAANREYTPGLSVCLCSDANNHGT